MNAEERLKQIETAVAKFAMFKPTVRETLTKLEIGEFRNWEGKHFGGETARFARQDREAFDALMRELGA